jgi:drug/metabolite transporter (DMT)-like permease
MNLVALIDFLRNRLKTVVWVCYLVLGLLVVLDAMPAVVDKHHAHTAAEHLPGFWSIFGLVGCLLLVVISKFYGRLGIAAREDYYDE